MKNGTVRQIFDLFIMGLSTEKSRAPAKKNNHRAMDDIRESIKEKYYKETIFKANKGRR